MLKMQEILEGDGGGGCLNALEASQEGVNKSENTHFQPRDRPLQRCQGIYAQDLADFLGHPGGIVDDIRSQSNADDHIVCH